MLAQSGLMSLSSVRCTRWGVRWAYFVVVSRALTRFLLFPQFQCKFHSRFSSTFIHTVEILSNYRHTSLILFRSFLQGWKKLWRKSHLRISMRSKLNINSYISILLFLQLNFCSLFYSFLFNYTALIEALVLIKLNNPYLKSFLFLYNAKK